MRRNKTMRNLLLFSLSLLLISCGNPESEIPDFERIINDEKIEQFKYYKVTPYQRKENVTSIILPSGLEYLVEDIDGVPSILNVVDHGVIYDSLNEQVLLNEFNEIISTLNEFNIVAFVSDSLTTKLYINYQDSTYDELKEQYSDYRDIDYREDKSDLPYNYVLLNISSSRNQEVKLEEKYAEFYSLRKLRADWYYYRSQYYVN